MLVLTRKQSQQIRVGDQIVITVLRVEGKSVRLGIEAPREVRVVRSELPRHTEQPSGERAAAVEAVPVSEAQSSPYHVAQSVAKSVDSARQELIQAITAS